jgi:tetratricopeptide (TPR) repeat protein
LNPAAALQPLLRRMSTGNNQSSSDPAHGNGNGLPAWVLCLLIGVATLLAYSPTFGAGYVWNDVDYVTRAELRSLHGLWRIWFDLGATEQYYPLLHSTFWVEHFLWGDAALGYHLANILLHATSACLLAFALRRLAVPGAWLAAGIFALHPVCVESVAWISEQKNTLSTMLFLSAGLIYLHYDQSRQRRHYWLATAVFILALFSKSLTATLPPALLVVFWWQRGRLEWRQDVVPLLPWFVLGAAVGLFTGWFEHNIIIGGAKEEFGLTLLERGLVAGRAIWFYLGKTLWPANLIFIYPRWTVNTAEALQYLFPLGVVALLGMLCWLQRRWRGPLAAMLIFTGTLFPVMGFFNLYAFMFSYVADHWQYLPMISLIVPVAVGLTYLRTRLSAWTLGMWGGDMLILSLLFTLGVMTWCQSWNYQDEETLYRATLERNPASWMSHHNLALLLAARPGRQAEAIAHYEESLRLHPNDHLAHNNLAIELSKIPGRQAEAIAHYETALRLRPTYAAAYNNLAIEFSKIPGRQAEAIAHFKKALLLKPDFLRARINLAIELAKIPGRQREAIALYEQVLQFEPGNAQAHFNLGGLLLNVPGRLADARAHFEAAARLKPRDARAHHNYGFTLVNVPGRLPEAIAAYETALRLKPDYPEANNNLGSALLRLPGREADAIAQFEAALRQKPDFTDARFNLAVALLKMPGREADAIAQFETLLRQQPNDAEAHNRLGELLLKSGRRLEAYGHFETAVRLKPDYRAARDNLARLNQPGNAGGKN